MLFHGITLQISWSGTQRPQRSLPKIKVTELGSAFIDALDPYKEAVTTQLNDEQVTFPDQAGSDQHLASVRVHRTHGKLLNCHRQSGRRWTRGWSWACRSKRLLYRRWRQTPEFASYGYRERIGGAVMGQQFCIAQAQIRIAKMVYHGQLRSAGICRERQITGRIGGDLGGGREGAKEHSQGHQSKTGVSPVISIPETGETPIPLWIWSLQ